MSDCYLALVDPTADATNARERAEKLRDALISEGIILAQTSESCVYGGVGHLPGPRLNASYVFADAQPDRPPEIHYWDMLAVCGVEIHAEKWVNFFGITVFEWARCPDCQHIFDSSSGIMTPLLDAVGGFLNEERPSVVRCPSCAVEHDIRSWTTEPHLGLCHLAAVFWNWPDFDAKGWRISIPQIASNAVGSQLVRTYGRM